MDGRRWRERMAEQLRGAADRLRALRIRAQRRAVELHRRVAWGCWRPVVARLPLAWIEFVAAALWCCAAACSARVRRHGRFHYDAGRDLYGQPAGRRLRVMSGSLLETLLDQRLHLGRQANRAERWPDLDAAGALLARRIAELRRERPGRPVIVAPFHYVSQYAQFPVLEAMGASLGVARIAVVSGVPRDRFGDDSVLIPSFDVLHTEPGEARHALGLRVARALARDGVAVLFADVPPYMLSAFPMETVGVSILGRAARIHRGVFRIGARTDAMLLPYYLTFARGRFGVRLFEPVPLAADDAPQQVANCIGRALTDNYAHFVALGFPSLYGYAPLR